MIISNWTVYTKWQWKHMIKNQFNNDAKSIILKGKEQYIEER